MLLSCGKKGHLAPMCSSKAVNKPVNKNSQNFLDLKCNCANDLECDCIEVKPIFVNVKIDDASHEFLLDTGTVIL